MKRFAGLFCGLLVLLMAFSATALAEEAEVKRFEEGKELVLFEQDGIKVSLTGEVQSFPESGEIRLSAVVENNSEKTIGVPYTGTLNGLELFGGYGAPVASSIAIVWPGMSKDGNVSIKQDYLNVEDKEDVECALNLQNFDNFETMELNIEVRDANGSMFTVDPITIYFPGYKGEDGTLQTLKNGSRGDAVVKLQEKLIELGYLDGEADGAYGKNTAKGVSSFQAAEGLKETGIADAITQERLFAK